MLERGSRYIITTKDNLYVTPSVKVIKDRNKVLFPLANGGEFMANEIPASEVLSIHKEDYVKNDITEELIPLEDISLSYN